MSNEYTAIASGDTSLYIYEQSDRFDISLRDFAGEPADITDLKAKDLVAMSVEIMKVASYFMDPEDIQRAIDEHVKDRGGYTVGVRV